MGNIVQRMTIREALKHESGIRTEAYRIYIFRDGKTVFYVGHAGNTYNRFLSHLGIDGRDSESRVGAFIRENAPASGDWLFEQYTVEECRPHVESWFATFPEDIRAIHASTGNIYDVDDAEHALIKLHRPYFNTSMNPHPLPLPERYKYGPRDSRRAENRKADELAALYGIE